MYTCELGGLSCAISCLREGLDVQMFEKAKELGEVSETGLVRFGRKNLRREFAIIVTFLREHTCMLAISVL